MFIKYERTKDKKTNETKTYLCVVESYWDIDGKPKHRRIKSFGQLEKQADPVAYIAMIEAEIPLLERQFSKKFEFTVEPEDNVFGNEFNNTYNYGYKYLEAIFDELKLDRYFDELQESTRAAFSIKDIFKFLVLSRILNPDSKRATLQHCHTFFGKNFDFSLDDIYRCMTLIAPKFDEIQSYISTQIDKIIKRDKSKIYYDCTNYYCEIDFNDTIENLRHRGVSKEHRVDPIVGFGLFLDGCGLPLKCQVFNGNVAECKMLIPGIKSLKADKSVGRVIMVADKGLNTSSNITELVNNGDGYVFSQILRGKKGKRYHEHVCNDDGYTKIYDKDGRLIYKHKTFLEEYFVTDSEGKQTTHTRKVLVYYSLDDDLMAKAKRAEKLDKAEISLGNNVFGLTHGYRQYLTENLIDPTTGEVITDKVIKEKTLDLDKAENDALFDGYFCLITSETDYTEEQIRKTYKGLWEIEQTFRITKTDLEFRPIYHFKKENIQSHFLICFCSLLVLRLLQHTLRSKGIDLSPERIVAALNSMNLENIKGYVHLHNPATSEAIADTKTLLLIIPTWQNTAYLKLENFRPFLTSITFHTITA